MGRAGTGIPAETLEAEAPPLAIPGGKAGFALWLRMLFSCLVDADFLDTEAVMDGGNAGQRGAWPGWTPSPRMHLRRPISSYRHRQTGYNGHINLTSRKQSWKSRQPNSRPSA
ncbi:MAG: hypothetical protein D6720_10550 [Gammaproteobacteria bacterium]|nr:MAG: hypothetical protein D6720_10550 [Gammaproteobacteria bacterium]